MKNNNHKTMLSEHFALEEFTYSRIAIDNALDNTPPSKAKSALQHLATCLLEPLREYSKVPVAILSGFRSDAVNRLAGGVATSQHRLGEAADCYIAEGPEKLLALLKSSGLPFDQAIVYKRRRFLHLSLKQSGKNRMQILFYMVCFFCLLSGCGMRKAVYRQENGFRNESVGCDRSDSLLLQARLILHDSLSLELKQIVFLPPDSSGRQALQSLTATRLQRVSNSLDSLIITSDTQQSYSNRTEEKIQIQEVRRTGNYRYLIFVAIVFCFFIGGYQYMARKG